ncbi:glycosyltransferase family 2 protein [Celeribacter sp.]|uniref:glycosyltransferase family 2 protein n=1 Tax=Celeribacter sp. TaxID=1890673 RepID=UPI003A940507
MTVKASTHQTLTVVILTKNEARHIERCIRSVAALAKRVCVVDSGSTDDTVSRARAMGADVHNHPWTNHATQFNWALDNLEIATDWVMRLDADEYLDSTLAASLAQFLAAPPPATNAAIFKRQIVFLDQPIRHGFFYPQHVVRLWRNGQGRVEERWMDEHLLISEEKSVILDGDLVDHNLNDLAWWTQKHNGYAIREVYDIVNASEKGPTTGANGLSARARAKRLAKTKLYARIPRIIRPTLYFLYRYILGAGFLDGRAGFYFHFLQAYWYRTLVDAKLLELEKRAAREGLSAHALLVREGILPPNP